MSDALTAVDAGVPARRRVPLRPVPLLEARDLVVVREGDSGPLPVLDGVSLSVASSEVVDVTGPSGAGKTTLLRALARMLPGATGSLLLAGRPADAFSPEAWRALVALVPQRAVLVSGTVRENLLVPWTLKVRQGQPVVGDETLRDTLDRAGLADVNLSREASRLSVGQGARVALLRVLLTAPDVLLLDEPDANLDEESAAQVAAMTVRFAEAGGGVVRVRHTRPDGVASRRLRLAGGRFEEVAS